MKKGNTKKDKYDKENNIYTQKPSIDTIEILPKRGNENGRWTWAKQKVENEKYNIFTATMQ